MICTVVNYMTWTAQEVYSFIFANTLAIMEFLLPKLTRVLSTAKSNTPLPIYVYALSKCNEV
jgi:hypothetical protein